MPPRCTVVVSHWTGHSRATLRRCLRSLRRRPAGAPFRLVVVCNGGDLAPLRREDLDWPGPAEVLNRANAGYNIGAWSAGRDHAADAGVFLFLQSECRALRAGWLSGFLDRLDADPGLGLLGERMMWAGEDWDALEARIAAEQGLEPGDPANPARAIRAGLARRGVPEGAEARHLQSLILCARAEALAGLRELPTGDASLEAVAGEVAITRAVVAAGWRYDKAAAADFHYIVHPQWTPGAKRWKWLTGDLRKALAWARRQGRPGR